MAKRCTGRHVAQQALSLCALVCVLLLVPACTSIRPVVKIALLAPFEGLYRRTGYAALDAMRTALAEAPQGSVDVLPLALDHANDPVRAQRSAQKLLFDPNVAAVIGPLLPSVLPGVAPVLESHIPLWLAPLAADQHGFANPTLSIYGLEPLVITVAEEAHRQGCRQLVLAGWRAHEVGALAALQATNTALPLVHHENPAVVQSTDAVLYLGDPDQAAVYLHHLRVQHPEAPFFLGPQGEDPVFAEHAEISGPVYWVTWLDDAYDGWARQQETASPAFYRVYRATQQILAQLAGDSPALPDTWQPYFFAVDVQGQSHPLEDN